MAQHKSAIKRIRRNGRARVRNKQYLSTVKTAVKKFRLAVLGAGQGSVEKTTVRPLFVEAQMQLAKAAAKGLLHKNNVARRIGRLSAMLKSAEAGEVARSDFKAQKKSAAARRAETTTPAAAASAAATPAKAKATKAAPAAKAPSKTATKAPAKKK